MVLLQLGDTSMPMAQITTNGHADVCGLHFHLSPSLFLWSMLSPPPRILLRSMVLLQPGTCWYLWLKAIDVHGLSSCLNPCLYLWSLLPPETMLRSMMSWHWGHVDVCGLSYHQKPCRSPWSVFPLSIKGKEASFVVVSITAVSTVKEKRRRRLLWQPLLHLTRQQPRQEAI